ncbi:VCBS repeat-containing protein [Streptomyces sp. P9(2023)]|uniref:FG-GAP repeat domain-containing protein n=1 Tax=Streptomyces sp. P9(2023) TaxID=3064394 RepID=UPI0028F3EC83|nr:VCBS repeat-containing protein [Streptomyces sp. P9(2023)]MDT9690553.1 VCBS repeat-containing protein [Streptomyces sp. P9(2023)]
MKKEQESVHNARRSTGSTGSTGSARSTTSGRRLAAAVLTLSTVTAVTGTLVVAGPAAVAAPQSAPASPVGPAQATDAVLPIPADAEIVSSGTTGFLTARPDGAGGSTLTWTKFADGSTTPIEGTRALKTSSDTVVTVDGSRYTFRDMAAGGFSSHSIDLVQVLGPEATFVGVAGTTLFATKPDGYGDPELRRISRQNGVLVNQLLSNYKKEQSYQVLGASGTDVLVLSTIGTGTNTTYHRAVADLTGDRYAVKYQPQTGAWNLGVTGAITPKYMAWTEHPGSSTKIVVDDRAVWGGSEHSFDLGAGQSAVLAGIVGDWVAYGQTDGGTATEPNALHPLTARSLTGAGTVKLLDHMSSSAVAPDGSLLVRGGTVAYGEGLYRITAAEGGAPVVTQVARTGQPTAVEITGSTVPAVAELDRNNGRVTMRWEFSRPNVYTDVTLRHVASGKTLKQRLYQPSAGTFTWNGLLDGVSAPNGTYRWEILATPLNNIGGAAYSAGEFKVTRQANPHDYTDNGSTDVLARDASGTLWRDDTFDWPVSGQVTPARRTKIGTGWNTYAQIEAAGNIAGGAAGDLVARDTTGVLWHYLGKGDGTFTARTKIGGGWGGYNKIAAGSDLNGDGRPDLLATDTAGDLWLYKGTGSASAPFGARVRIGGGWSMFNQLTAVGNIAGGTAGDLVARDKDGVLWLYQGKGDGTFTARTRIGAGWNAFSQLVGVGDTNNDGRPDLLGHGADGTYVYLGTGSATAPFSRANTSLYAGEGTKFTMVS